ncbi:MAG: hypothetical protein GC158_12890 [Cyanobacteria bacterium RI_101]|nr:hypothetical protein [Cyanobacteria bacterium RI_101]
MMNDVRDFAERVKKFYYSRALLCEKLIDGAVTINGLEMEMPPSDFNPFENFYIESYLIGCAAIDGLAFIWEQESICENLGNKIRFTKFLTELDTHKRMERVCTPFLVFHLKKKRIEEPFVNKVKAKWLESRHQCESHRVYEDPTVSELKTIYQECHRQNPIPDNKSLRDSGDTFSSFTYATLIYKFYRCPFVHELRGHKYATFFNKKNEISVREFHSTIPLPDEIVSKASINFDERMEYYRVIEFDEVKPQLDIGIGVLTDSIRRGADKVFDLILDKQLTDIPYGSKDEIKINVGDKQKGTSKNRSTY